MNRNKFHERQKLETPSKTTEGNTKSYSKLSSNEYEPENSFASEIVIDLVLIAIGFAIFFKFDSTPLISMIGFALAGIGGIRMLFAMLEAIIWKIGTLFSKKKKDS